MKIDCEKMLKVILTTCCISIFSNSVTIAAITTVNKTVDSIASLKSTAVVNGSEINADSLIKNECCQAIRNELANIRIGHIPLPLGELTISRTDLQKKLGILTSKVEIPEKVTIRRSGAILKGSDVGNRIAGICKQNGSDDLSIDLSRIPANIVLPGNVLNWEINTNSDNTLGMRLFVLNAQTDNGPFRQLIQVKVSRIIEAAQLLRLAKPGELISRSMIKPQKMEIKSDLSNIPLTFTEAVGKHIGRFKSAGTVLRTNDISKKMASADKIITSPSSSKCVTSKPATSSRDNWLIQPGDAVNFHFSSGSLSMDIPAKAIQGGQIGEEISLINLKNKKTIRGIITEKGKVEYAKK